jgi:hypothetical protein
MPGYEDRPRSEVDAALVTCQNANANKRWFRDLLIEDLKTTDSRTGEYIAEFLNKMDDLWNDTIGHAKKEARDVLLEQRTIPDRYFEKESAA